MERSRNILIILLWGWVAAVCGQQQEAIYKAYLSGNMQSWKRTMDQLSRNESMSDSVRLDLVNYQYGYIAWSIDQKRTTEAREYLRRAQHELDRLERKGVALSLVYAYRSAFVGYEIGMAPYKAPYLGSKSESYARKSVEEDPQNPLGYVQLGNIAFYKPALFGGSKKEALKQYQRALGIMERTPRYTHQNWNYLNLMVMLVRTLEATEQYAAALDCCNRLLKIEPEFLWAKNSLYPQLTKKKTP